MRNLEKMNQFAVLLGEFKMKNNNKSVNINETVTVEMIELQEKYNNYDDLEFLKRKSLKSDKVELYLNYEESIPMLGQDNETIIGYKFPLFVERDLEIPTTVVIITFENPD